MRRLQLTSATGICTVFLLVVFEIHTLLLYDSTHAFSPSTIVRYTPQIGSKFKQGETVLGMVTSSPTETTSNTTSNESFPIRYNTNLVRFRCRIAYDGTSFAGFQLQGGREKKDTSSKNHSPKPNLTKQQNKNLRKSLQHNNPRTIQEEVEKVLSMRFQRLVKVVGAGRTDGGVHARGQAMHFDLYKNETTAEDFEQQLELTISRMLPSDIRAWNVNRATPTLIVEGQSPPPGYYNWNAMRSCDGKLYSYRICIGDSMDPIDRYNRWQLPWQGVDPSNLRDILKKFEGEHDFVCFAGALEQQEKKTGVAPGTVRTIQRIDFVHEVNGNNDAMCNPSQDYYRIDIYLDGALYKMVRNIVGTAIDVARGWLDETKFEELLNQPSEFNYVRKDNPCKPAPANGLTLERVFYPDDF